MEPSSNAAGDMLWRFIAREIDRRSSRWNGREDGMNAGLYLKTGPPQTLQLQIWREVSGQHLKCGFKVGSPLTLPPPNLIS